MRIGLCKLCLSQKPLCDSHALPNSLFNYILRSNSGKAIVITDDEDTPARLSSDTWDVELLCETCERKLNRNYDSYGIAVFRGHQGAVSKHSEGVDLLRVERRRLRMFFLSVLWRISVSNHPSYLNISLPHALDEDLRNAFNTESSIPDSRYTVAIYKMRDSTPMKGFGDDTLRGFIAAPFARNYGVFMSVCYPFFGFLVEIFLSRVPKQYLKRRGVIFGSSPVLSIPYVEVLDIPEIMSMLVNALRNETRSELS